jgi:ligand-binding sensor domain-containing protein
VKQAKPTSNFACKALLAICWFLLLFYSPSFGQSPQWQVYTYGKNVTSLASFGDTLWAGTESGVVKISKRTGGAEYYEHSNTNTALRFVSTLAVSADGLVSAGTVYDGVFNLESNGWILRGGYWRVQALTVDQNDDLWIGYSDPRLVRHHRSGVTVWATDFNIQDCGRPANSITSLACDKQGAIWVGLGSNSAYNGGIGRFDGKNWSVFDSQNSPLPSGPVYSIAIAQNGVVWVAFLFNGVAKFSGGSWTVYNTGNSPLPTNYIYTLAIDSTDRVWMGTWYSGLVSFDGTTWKRYVASSSGLPSNYVQALLAERDGRLWVATTRGLALFDGTTWRSYETSSSTLPGPYMNAIEKDRNSNVWISCHSDWNDEGGGLVKVSGTQWKIFDRTNAPYAVTDISAIRFDWDNTLWATTWYDGLLRFDGTTWKHYTPSNSRLEDNQLTSLSLDLRGHVWIGTYDHGIVRFDGSTWTKYDLVARGAPSNKVHSIQAGSNGVIWIGTDRGLVKFNPLGDLTVFNSSNTPFPHDTINVIRFDKHGVLWVGTQFALGSLDGSTWRVLKLPGWDGWWSDVRDFAFEDPGITWVATNDQGLMYYDGGLSWKTYDYTTSPFPGEHTYCVTIDDARNKWAGAWNGLAVYRVQGVKFAVDSVKPTQSLVNFPNPFRDVTRIVFSLDRPARIQIVVFNLLGQKIKTLLDESLNVGQHALLWDGTDEHSVRVQSGVYFYRMQTDTFFETRKLILVK